MRVLGCDLGNKSINGLALLEPQEGKFFPDVIDYTAITYSKNPYEHRKVIISKIQDYISRYNLTKDDYILFEKINLFRGSHISRLANIKSLAFLQATIINAFSDFITISEVDVRAWKAKVLKNGNAGKDESILYVQAAYPNVDLNIAIKHKRKADEVIVCHDLADAVCIANYGADNLEAMSKNIVNYQ